MNRLCRWTLFLVLTVGLSACAQDSSNSPTNEAPNFGEAANTVAFEERRIAVVFSDTTAKHYFDEFAYGQLFTAMQHQAMQAGMPYDVLSESDLTDSVALQQYNALIIPLMSHVDSSHRDQIINALLTAQSSGTAIITASEFLTYDQNNNAFGDAYSGMIQILGLTPLTYQVGVPATLRVSGTDHPITADYAPNQQLGDYEQSWFAEFAPVEPTEATTIVEARVNNTKHAAMQVLERAGRVVHFANDAFLADKNLVWPAVRWAIYGDKAPVSLLPSRSSSVFVARNDMDQAMIPAGLAENEVPLLDIIRDWKRDYNFVGSYYIDIGNDPIRGEYTNWNFSTPLYADYLALGNEFGTHSWTHPHYTSELTNEELEFEFNQSKQEISTQLGINVIGGAVPGNPENLNVVENLNQWFEYFSGRSITGALGYRSGYGYLNPKHNMRYFNLNMTPDFGLIDFLNHTPVRAKKIWQDEYDALQEDAELPVMHWLWHDYGPTAQAATGRYSKDMFEETVKYAFDRGSEFVTLEDYHNRLTALETVSLSTGVNDSISASVTGTGLGQFALKIDSDEPIASVSNWYAYSDTAVFVPDNGGEFTIHTGAEPEQYTRIIALPMRANLISVSGNGNEIDFSFFGEGAVTVKLSPAMQDNARVEGADSFDVNNDELVLQFQEAKQYTVSITAINPINSKPVANGASATTAYATPVQVTLSAQDPNQDVLNYTLTSMPINGTLSGDAPTLTYTPENGYSGIDTFSFIVNDGEFDSDGATVSVTVGSPVAANSIPVANKAVLNTTVGQSVPVQLSGSDNEGQALQYTLLTQPDNGSLSGAVPALSYQPAAGFSGVDEFSFAVSDGTNESDAARVVIHVTAQPLPSNGTVSNAIATNVSIDGNLSEWSGVGAFGLDVNETGVNGQYNWKQAWISHDANAFYIAYEQYQPAALEWRNQIYLDTDTNRDTGFRGFANEYAIGADFVVEGAALLEYTGTGTDWSWRTVGALDAAVNGALVEILIPRTQLADTQIIDLFFQSIRDDNTRDFYPDDVANADAVAYTRRFSYSVAANQNPDNAAPVAHPLELNTANNADLPIKLTGFDLDGDALSFELTTQPANGTLFGTAPDLGFMPAAGFTGPDTFKFIVNDGSLTSNTATVVINVVPPPALNGIPVALNQSHVGQVNTPITIALSGSDYEGSELSFRVVTNPVNGVLSGEAPALTYTPNAGYTGNDSFTYQVGDGTSYSKTATVSLVVEAEGGSNTPPAADNQSVIVEHDTALGIVLSGSDQDGDDLSYRIQTQPVSGTLSGTAPNLTYTPFNNASGPDSFTFSVNDGVVDSATVSVSIDILPAPVANRAPMAIGQTVNTAESEPVSITLTGTDADNDQLSFVITQSPAGGRLSGNGAVLVYTPNAGFSGIDRVYFQANDGSANSIEAVVTINVASAPATTVSNLVTQLTIDGDMTDWIGLQAFADDPDDVSGILNPLNWRTLVVAHDADNFYFLYRNDGSFTLSWGHGMYIDVDGNSNTGFRSFNNEAPIGSDYLIEGSSVHRYTGTGNDWSWQYIGSATAALNHDVLEFSVPRTMLSDASTLQMYLRASNEPFGGNIIDLYPDVALTTPDNSSTDNTVPRTLVYSTEP